ncbi:MAG: hypothetical protein LUQ32_10380 [Methanomicrobiales archaeon]|nr:hypothetical protein [Methanomicrobiales archaeon]
MEEIGSGKIGRNHLTPAFLLRLSRLIVLFSAKDILFVVNATTEKILIPPDGEGDEKIPMVAAACGELHETGVQRAFGNL